MKKVLALLFLLFIPFMVNAEVKIKEAVLVDSTEGLEAEKNPHHEGLELEIDMKLAEVGEYAKYKLTIENDTKKDYEIDMGEAFSKKEYIKYEFSFVDDEEEEVLKASSTKDIYVLVTYNKEVPENEFVNGVYKDDNVMTINLSNNEEQPNPETKTGYAILAIAIVLLISVLLILFNKYKLEHLMVLVIAVAIALPLSIYALEKITIKIQAQIEIENNYRQLRVLSCHFEPNDETYNSIHRVYRDDLFKIRKDMTINSIMENPSEFAKLNPNLPDISMDEIDYYNIYPTAYYTCSKRVPILEWKPNMTQEEQNEYNAYRRNLNTCYQELTEEDWNTIPQNYNNNSILLTKDQAVYFVNACPEAV